MNRTTVNVEKLLHGSLWSRSVDIGTWTPEDEDAREAIEITQAFTYTDDMGRDWTLVAQDDAVRWIAVVSDAGTDFYAPNDYPSYQQNYSDEESGELFDGAMEEPEFDALFDVEPRYYGAEGPMMNYWYPCPAVSDGGMSRAAGINGVGNAAQAAVKLIGVPLCVVEVGDTAGLALTGGGMDFTWEICEAFIALGQLPPAHFARRLPGMAGRGKSDHDKLIVAACRRSLAEAAESITRDLARLDESAATWQGRS